MAPPRRSARNRCSTSARASRRSFTRTRSTRRRTSRSASSRFRCSSWSRHAVVDVRRRHVVRAVARRADGAGKTTTSTISGLTDTQIRGHYVLGNDFVVLTGGRQSSDRDSRPSRNRNGARGESDRQRLPRRSRSRTWERDSAAPAVSRSRGRSATGTSASA